MRPFYKTSDLRQALKLAEEIAASFESGRDYFLNAEVAQIFECDIAVSRKASRVRQFPQRLVVNRLTVFNAAEVFAYLHNEKQMMAYRQTRRQVHPMSNLAPAVLPRAGTRTRLVLSLLQAGPKTTAELTAVVGAHPNKYVYVLRRQGHQIRTDMVSIIDAHGHPHAAVALYTLVEAGS